MSVFARTTWLDLKTELRQQIWPAGEPQNLVAAHDKHFIEAIIDLQQSVDCLQYNNTSIFPHCSTYFQCGLTVLEAPYGTIRRVYTVDRINQTTGREDANVATDWCSKIHYQQTRFCHLEDYVSKTIACACSAGCSGGVSLSQLFAWPPGLCNKNTFNPPTDAGWEGFDALPQGLHYPQESTDSTCGRSKVGVWALRRGRIYLAPWIQSTETVVVEWDGIKREWNDEDLIDSDPLLKRAIRYYVQAQSLRDYDNEFDKAELIFAEFQKARSELMYNCREVTRVRGCEESKAMQSIASSEMAIRGAGDSDLPDNDPANVGDQTGGTAGGCTVPGSVEFDPPAGSIVAYPIFVTLTSASPAARIHFTTDGSTPTVASPRYSIPFQLVQGDQVRAIAVDGACISPVTSTDYVDVETIYSNAPELTTLCTRDDFVGRWYVFHADGSPDINWRFAFDAGPGAVIKRLEMYETTASGAWNTGRAWATEYTIRPFGGAPFNTYPLGIVSNGALVNNGYTSDLGLNSETGLWKLSGESVGVPTSGSHYRLVIVMRDGNTVYATSTVTCQGDDCAVIQVADDGTGAAAITTAYGTSNVNFVFDASSGQWIFADLTSPDATVQALTPGLGQTLPCSQYSFTAPVTFVLKVNGTQQQACFSFPCGTTTTTTTTTTSSTTTLPPETCDGCPGSYEAVFSSTDPEATLPNVTVVNTAEDGNCDWQGSVYDETEWLTVGLSVQGAPGDWYLIESQQNAGGFAYTTYGPNTNACPAGSYSYTFGDQTFTWTLT